MSYDKQLILKCDGHDLRLFDDEERYCLKIMQHGGSVIDVPITGSQLDSLRKMILDIRRSRS